eukprot:1496813-Rhodomonas_salina.1
MSTKSSKSFASSHFSSSFSPRFPSFSVFSRRRNSTECHHKAKQEVMNKAEEKEWSAIGAGELARVAEFSRVSSAESCSSDAATSSPTLHEARSTQNRMMGLMLERSRSETESKEEMTVSQSNEDRYTAEEDAWAQEFEALCSC